MFTGIIESVGVIKEKHFSGTNRQFVVESTISDTFKIDQSISHNGVCLTVEAVYKNTHTVTAVSETLHVSNLKDWEPGTLINLEQCMVLNGRLDGHIVQGHVDATARCLEIIEKNGSTEYRFEFDKKYAPLVIEKGSVCLNGISLTVFNVIQDQFTVTIIPYTLEHTNMQTVTVSSIVNIEFDVIGKYILRQRELTQSI